MKIRFLTKVSQHKRFYFVPRYYDERKERLDRMVEKYAEREKENDENADQNDFRRHEALRQSMTETWGRDRRRAKQRTGSNARVVLIIIAILAVGYLVFKPSSKNSEQETIVHQLD